MTHYQVTGGRPLRGHVRVPGDKSISHRALILAGLAQGTSRLSGLSDGADVAGTAAALSRLGATVSHHDDGSVSVNGFAGAPVPSVTLDVGNSGTTMRLLAGALAPYDVEVTLAGDDSLSRRPMDRVAEPLTLMGAGVTGRGQHCLPPITVRGGGLRGIDYSPPMASAQVKGCVLLAGLGAEGETVVREPVPTRLHSEELLARSGIAVEEQWEGGAHVVRLRPGRPAPLELAVPGDPSQAAFWVVAATIVTGSDILIDPVYLGPGRRGFVDVLLRMGASITESPASSADAYPHSAELRVRSAWLQSTSVQAAEITGLDEVPVLALAAAVARGTTVFHGVGELRVKESDRFQGVLDLLGAFGARAEGHGDDLVVTGRDGLSPGQLDAGGDHRMAMAAVVAGLAAGDTGTTSVSGWEAVATSYPAFDHDRRTLTGQVGAEGR